MKELTMTVAAATEGCSARTERRRALESRGRAATIHFDSVRKEYVSGTSRSLAIECVDLRIEPGEFVCLLGRSGCGKSTLLNMVAGFLKPTQGRVLANGHEVNGPGLDRGIVAQNGALFPWLTALENVEFGMRMKKVPKAQRRQEARRLLSLFGLEQFEGAYPRQLSGGMQQRVAIARAMAITPKILLMDEPFGALDDITRHAMQAELLRAWINTTTTVIFVTHSISEAVFLADRVVVMAPRPGRIIEDIAIKLSDPRDQATTEFANYYGRIRKALGAD